MPTHRSRHGGRAELGQNDLHDPATIDAIVRLVRRTRGPILEIGAGRGALTRPLAALGRPLVAVELDEHRVAALRRELPGVDVVHADATRHRIDPRTRVVVGNLPFHVTTPLLRHVLAAPAWTDAVLLVQWEVARKRAGVGGSTMMTAQTAPWFELSLARRVPASAFRPRPGVDGGVLVVRRRAEPLVPPREQRAYAELVRRVFTGPGRGVAEVLARVRGVPVGRARAWCAAAGVDRRALPRDVTPQQWAALWRSCRRP
jgi:23S rRNA (adenine-N6)-dimethyltransferase